MARFGVFLPLTTTPAEINMVVSKERKKMLEDGKMSGSPLPGEPCDTMGISYSKEDATAWCNIYEAKDTKSKEKFLYLNYIKVKKSAPKGTGTQIMKQICEYADTHGLTITLDIASKGDFKNTGTNWKITTSQNRLVRFYKRFGFLKNGTKRRFDLQGTWHRPPTKTKTT